MESTLWHTAKIRDDYKTSNSYMSIISRRQRYDGGNAVTNER